MRKCDLNVNVINTKTHFSYQMKMTFLCKHRYTYAEGIRLLFEALLFGGTRLLFEAPLIGWSSCACRHHQLGIQ